MAEVTEALRAYGERIQRPEYWHARGINQSGFEESE